MPGTYSKLLFHIVFSTKNRANLIPPDFQPRVHEYLGGIVRSLRGAAPAIGGIADHVHLLVRWRTDESLAALLRTVKSRSTIWIRNELPAMHAFSWQEGYAAFSVSHSQSPAVERYIAGQAEHHRTRSFEDELRDFLKRHEIEFEERYLLG
jgi:REP element-mobilizing transposase RayT